MLLKTQEFRISGTDDRERMSKKKNTASLIWFPSLQTSKSRILFINWVLIVCGGKYHKTITNATTIKFNKPYTYIIRYVTIYISEAGKTILKGITSLVYV